MRNYENNLVNMVPQKTECSLQYQEPVKDVLPYYIPPIQHHTEVLASAIRKRNNRITVYKLGRKKLTFLGREPQGFYPKKSLIGEFSKVAGY